ncbi:MAG: hypothetical protein J5789_00715 [Oscillospiraceae bacterium]|nr:hypothetical protein [Oscillospiraceae bacterium]
MKLFKKVIPGLALLVAGVVGRLLLSGAETSVLINSGMRTFRILVWIARGAMLIGGGLLLAGSFLLLLPLLQERRRVRASEELIARAKAESRKRAPLSTRSGAYNEDEIRDCLMQFFDSTPAKFTPYLERYQSQLDRMNSYQARLNRMLRQNGADDLTEAEALLDKLEQNVFGVMRKVFNWLTMYDASTPDDPLIHNLEEAEAHNEKALEQAGRLCATITDYINNQGSRIDITNSVKSFTELLKEEIK